MPNQKFKCIIIIDYDIDSNFECYVDLRFRGCLMNWIYRVMIWLRGMDDFIGDYLSGNILGLLKREALYHAPLCPLILVFF